MCVRVWQESRRTGRRCGGRRNNDNIDHNDNKQKTLLEKDSRGEWRANHTCVRTDWVGVVVVVVERRSGGGATGCKDGVRFDSAALSLCQSTAKSSSSLVTVMMQSYACCRLVRRG